MISPFDVPLVPGLFIYTDRSKQKQGFLFQFNPETLKRSRTVALQDSNTNQPNGTSTGRGNAGRKYSMKASRWKIDFDIRLDASRMFPKQLGMMIAQAATGQGLAALNPFGSVMAGIRQLEALVEPTEIPVTGGKRGLEENPETPVVEFYWGDRVWSGYVTSLSFNEALFSALLMPMVVEASISMEIIEPMSSLLAGITGGNR